jgi:hypothetical protein
LIIYRLQKLNLLQCLIVKGRRDVAVKRKEEKRKDAEKEKREKNREPENYSERGKRVLKLQGCRRAKAEAGEGGAQADGARGQAEHKEMG